MRISTSANIVAVALISLVGVLVSVQVYGIFDLRQVQAQKRLAADVTNAVLDLTSLVNEMQTRPNARVERQYVTRVDSLESLLVDLETRATRQLPLIIRMRSSIERIRASVDGMSGQDFNSQARTTLRHSFLAASHALASLAKRLFAYHSREIDKIEDRLLLVTIVAAVVILGLIMMVYALFVAGVMRPLVGFRDRVMQIAADELEAPANAKEQRNELAEIAVEFDRRYSLAQAATESLRLRTAELERSNKDLEAFAYAASHDLRSPLRGIMTTAEWIGEDLRNGVTDETAENLKLLKSRAQRLDNLLKSLLEYSRAISDTGDKASVEDVDVGAMVADIATLISPPSGFAVTFEGASISLRTTPVRLQQVMQNLIDNAIKHHDRDVGQVEVRAEAQGKSIRITVRDDGPGIKPQYHEQVTQIFRTLKRKDEKEASGLGLAMVKKVVEQGGGKLQITSPLADDRGCEISFTWPRRPA